MSSDVARAAPLSFDLFCAGFTGVDEFSFLIIELLLRSLKR